MVRCGGRIVKGWYVECSIGVVVGGGGGFISWNGMILSDDILFIGSFNQESSYLEDVVLGSTSKILCVCVCVCV